MNLFTRFIREPLVHFLIIGLVMFVAYESTQPQTIKLTNQIVVSQGQIQQLSAQFKRVSLRPPTQQELDKLIEGYVRDEVFYRQGLTLGLDIDDPVVKQRLRMKLEVLLEDLNEQAQPNDDVLLSFMEKHAVNYRQEAIYSFEHIYLDITKHENLDKTFATIKGELANNISIDTLGDRLILPAKLNEINDYDVIRLFGKEFSQGLSQLVINQWSSIIYSGYGAHIVKLTRITPSKIMPLAMVKAEVLRDYMVQRRDELKENTYQSLRKEYQVLIENKKDENKEFEKNQVKQIDDP